MHEATTRWAAVAFVALSAACRGGTDPNVPSNEAKSSMRPVETAPIAEREGVMNAPTPATSSAASGQPHVATSPPGPDTPPPSTHAAPFKPGNPLPAPTATGGGPKIDRGGSVHGDETRGNTGTIPGGPR